MHEDAGSFLWGRLCKAVSETPERTFVRTEHDSLSYRMFGSQVKQYRRMLLKWGACSGARILIINDDVLVSLLLVFASASLGCIFVVLDRETASERLDHITRDCEPLIVVARHLPGQRYGFVENWRGVAVWKAHAQPPAYQNPLSLAFIIYTSGSTGMPKGVALSNDNLSFVVDAIQQRLAYQPDDVVACYLPISFDYGLYQVFLACQVGATVAVRSPTPTSALLLKAVKEDGITVLPLVPSLWEVLLGALRLRSRKDSVLTIRMITSTGQALAPNLLDEMQAQLPAIELFSMYGLTECKRVSILMPEDYRLKHGSVGQALNGTEVWASDPQGNALAAGETGELVVMGKHVARYWRLDDEAADDQVFKTIDAGRLLFTGDYGHVDADGFIYVRGRQDTLVKHRGHRISLLEVEQAIQRLDRVQSVAVIHDAEHDHLIAFVVTSSPAESLRIQADARLGEVLERHKMPDRYIPLVSMPLTPNSKVDRETLRKLLLGASRYQQGR